MLGNGAIRRQKPLGMPGRFEALHAIFALPCGPMGVLTPVIEVATLAMLHPGQDLALRRAVALELIGNDHPWHVLQPLEQLAKELLRGLLIAPALHEDIKHVIILVDSAPEVMALPVDGQKDLINGLVTNDKFCMSRQSQIKLRWSRQPYRFRPRNSRYAPHEISHQGAYHETSVADTSTVSGVGRRGTTVESRLPASPAMEPIDRAAGHSPSHHVLSAPIGGKL